MGLGLVVSDPFSILLLFFGVFLGIIFGCIPGLTSVLGVTLIIPFTFTMTSVQGMAILLGIFVGGISGGLITAMLLNIPGTPASIVTCWDGFPMVKSGRPGDALTLGVYASMVGGLLSAFALLLIAPPLSRAALAFGPWEYFALATMGISLVVAMAGKNILKGLISAFLGILLSTVGMDSLSGVMRLTFDQWQLQAGISTIALLMGLFAITEIMVQTSQLGKGKNKELVLDKVPLLPKRIDLKGTKMAFLISSVIGTFVGILPGIGQTTGSMLAYNQVRQNSKNADKFGTGMPEGIIASETANNAVNGGALIPLITLGIPGDLVTAALLGGFLIHGLQPGPLFFAEHIDLAGAIMVLYFLSNIVMYAMEIGFMKLFIKIIDVPLYFLFPLIILTCTLGVLTVNNRIFDVWVLMIFGVVGYCLYEFDVALTPLILGFILGPLIELNFRTALIGSNGSFSELLSQPLALLFILVSILFLFMPYIRMCLGKCLSAIKSRKQES
ncbi:MAG: tripartite tricarboxylate transporter permease [Deltaproteobacteria bacterium]|nr:tripartite tricarboxylate transporter permease [Deltaproteobacteria bacterium]